MRHGKAPTRHIRNRRKTQLRHSKVLRRGGLRQGTKGIGCQPIRAHGAASPEKLGQPRRKQMGTHPGNLPTNRNAGPRARRDGRGDLPHAPLPKQGRQIDAEA